MGCGRRVCLRRRNKRRSGAKEIPVATASTNAKTYGILTGDGDNLVVNKGTIAVTAQTETTAVNQSEDDGIWMGARLMVESATGIQTGSGNDTIINEEYHRNDDQKRHIESGCGHQFRCR